MGVYWILAIIAVFWLGVNNWLFWPLLVVLWAASRVRDAEKIYILALVTGLLTDLLVGQKLGMTAAFLLLASGSLFFYRLFWRMPMVVLVVYAVILSFTEKLLWG